MKKVLLVALAISLVAAGIAFAGVAGSLHDLGDYAVEKKDPTNVNTGQVCVFCHHPHRGQVTFAGQALTNAILWNITDWDPSVYPVYDSNESDTFNATTAGDLINDGTSNAYASFFCMACHDGLIGNNALVRVPRDATNNTQAYDIGAVAPDADLGATLEDDHPVNFTVDTTLYGLDGGLQTMSGGSWASTALGGGANTYPMFASKMQCSTCHDVHRGSIGTEANCATIDSGMSCDNDIEFMLGDTTNSEICVDCHNK
jgi:hypothetical protein